VAYTLSCSASPTTENDGVLMSPPMRSSGNQRLPTRTGILEP